jgi:hypothetical protein
MSIEMVYVRQRSFADLLCAPPGTKLGVQRACNVRPAGVRASDMWPRRRRGAATESPWSRPVGLPGARRRTRVALESLDRDQFRAPRCGLLDVNSQLQARPQPRPHSDARGLFGRPGIAVGLARESPERPAGAQRARSGRAAGALRADRPTDFGLLDVDCYCMKVWPRRQAMRSGHCAYCCTVNTRARRAHKSRFRVGSRRPISATSVGIVTA